MRYMRISNILLALRRMRRMRRVHIRAYIYARTYTRVHIRAYIYARTRTYTRVHIRAYIYARTRGVQNIELFTLIRVILSRNSQSAWSLSRRHWQRVVSLAQKHTADIFLYSGWK